MDWIVALLIVICLVLGVSLGVYLSKARLERSLSRHLRHLRTSEADAVPRKR